MKSETLMLDGCSQTRSAPGQRNWIQREEHVLKDAVTVDAVNVLRVVARDPATMAGNLGPILECRSPDPVRLP